MHNRTVQNARVLVVDDELSNVRLLEEILEQLGRLNVRSTIDPREVFPLFVAFEPDLILLDLIMPRMDGFQVMEQIRPLVPQDSYLPILVLTADLSREARREALEAGANDFLIKPFDVIEVHLRVRNLLETRLLHLQLRDQRQLLERRVLGRTKALEKSQLEVLDRLAQAAEYRDDATGRHTRRVGILSALIAANLGLREETVDLIRQAAPLHDVGNIGIPDQILLKSGKLLPEEFEQVKLHTTLGANLLSSGQSAQVRMAERIALTHHERWDGTGYPHSLSEGDIPLEGRIVAVADVFDALIHNRPYKTAWTFQEAMAEIERQAGRHFDPDVAQVFLSLPPEVIRHAGQPVSDGKILYPKLSLSGVRWSPEAPASTSGN